MKAHKEFIQFFRTSRIMKGQTQEDVGLSLGYTTGQFIYHVESGRTLPPLSRSNEYAKCIGAGIKDYKTLLRAAMVEKDKKKHRPKLYK